MFALPLLERGSRTPLQDMDLDHLSERHCMPELVDRLEARWDIELSQKTRSLRCAFCHFLKKELILGGIFTFLLSVTRISQAVLLGVILSWMTQWSQKTGPQPFNASYVNTTANITAAHVHSLANATVASNRDQTEESVAVGFVAAFALIAVALAQIGTHHTMVNLPLSLRVFTHHYSMNISSYGYARKISCKRRV